MYDSIGSLLSLENGAVLCEDANTDISLDFALTGAQGQNVKIKVPMRDFVTSLYNGTDDASGLLVVGDESICALEMSPSHGQPFFGSDPFMRSAYAFFDLDR